MPKNQPLYFDYAATTPCDGRVAKIISNYTLRDFGNPGSLHGYGQKAIAAIDRARAVFASSLGANFRDVIFTASATEANNLILRGLVSKTKIARSSITPKIIISAIEHESILGTAQSLAAQGEIELVVLPVDRHGLVDLTYLERSLDSRTILVSIMQANNEIGIIQPIAEISEIIRVFREELRTKNRGPQTNPVAIRNSLSLLPVFHSDASQALQFLNCSLPEIGADFLTLSGHKIYGPKGVGALCARQKTNDSTRVSKPLSLISDLLSPVSTGGGQEFGLRSGTENVPAIAGFAKASELVNETKETEALRIQKLRERLWSGIKKIFPRARLNGLPIRFSVVSSADFRSLPNILNVCFPGQSAEELLIALDLNGIAVSSGSACAARSAETSHVLRAIGLNDKDAKSSLRISLGRPSNLSEVNSFLKILEKTIRSIED